VSLLVKWESLAYSDFPITIQPGLEEGGVRNNGQFFLVFPSIDGRVVLEHRVEVDPGDVFDHFLPVKVKAHPKITWFRVEAENYESIHNHNAWAVIETTTTSP
jgi:GTP cyclohydrolase I